MKHLPPLLVIALAVLAAVVVRPARAETFGSINVSVESSPTGTTTHGYAEYRVRVTNNSERDTHEVALALPASTFNRGDTIRRVSRTVVVGPRASALVPMPQPPLHMWGEDLVVHIDGRRQRRQVPLPSSSHAAPQYMFGHGHVTKPRCILVSQGVSGDFLTAAETALNPSPAPGPGTPAVHYSGMPKPHELIRADLPAAQWRVDWLAYSRFDGIVLDAADMAQMPAGVWDALLRYAETGGVLTIVGPWTPPAAWRDRAIPGEDMPTWAVGFGQCRAVADRHVQSWPEHRWRSLDAGWQQTQRPFAVNRDVAEANRALSVVEKLGIPVRGLLTLMIVFAVVVGPANFILLSRRNRQLWVYWTVPAVSLATCGIVFGYALIAEGIEGHSRVAAFTLLDETTHRATTIGVIGYYCPLTPRDGLRFSYDTELTPQVARDYYRGGGGTPRAIDWTRDQHLASGWVSARVTAHFQVRKSEVRRERISVEAEDDGSLAAVNGLGDHVRELWVADREGRVYEARDIAPGAKASLAPASRRPEPDAPVVGPVHVAADPSALRGIYQSDWSNVASAKANRRLQAGCYVAVLDSAPFVEPGLEGLKTRRAASIVYGIMANPPGPASARQLLTPGITPPGAPQIPDAQPTFQIDDAAREAHDEG